MGLIFRGSHTVSHIAFELKTVRASCPHLNGTVFAVIAIVFQPAARTDHRIIAAGVRGEMALQITCLHTVGKLQIDHIEILVIDLGVIIFLRLRRPVGIGPDALNRQSVKPLTSRRAPGDAAVNAQGTDAVHPDGAGIRQPVNDVDVMRAFLQQQRTGVLPVGMPVTEIGVAAIAHEMPAPDRLDFTDHTGLNDFSHPVRKFHVAHIVAEHQMGSVLFGRPQNPVGTFDGDGDRFFQINRGFAPQSKTCLFLVAEIG